MNIPLTNQPRIGGARVSTGKDSVQEVATPWEFINAVECRFGKLDFDLAASASNKKAERFYSKEDNALVDDKRWHKNGLCWLNPEFSDIAPWANRCAIESGRGARILLLVPASIDSNWWDCSVHGIATVLPLHPRIKFVGHPTLYPKPLALCVYGIEPVGYPGRWVWK